MAPYCSISIYLLLLLTTSTASPLSFNLSPITRDQTDFDTHFSFVIQADNPNCAADGLAFFLAPVNSTIPPNSSGAGLGLGFKDAPANASVDLTVDPFVAVEFDTFTNQFDTQGQHVGIDVRSLNSTVYAPWRNNLTEGNITDAWISYNSSNKKFLVTFNEFNVQPPQLSSIEYTIDLRTILPEFVVLAISQCFTDFDNEIYV